MTFKQIYSIQINFHSMSEELNCWRTYSISVGNPSIKKLETQYTSGLKIQP